MTRSQSAAFVTAVTRAWEIGSNPEPGKVRVLIVNDKTNPPSPSAQLVNDVAAFLESVQKGVGQEGVERAPAIGGLGCGAGGCWDSVQSY